MKATRIRNGITSLSGLLLGAIAATMVHGGCIDECGEYVECTTAPGLRYVLCGESTYRFNDGAEFSSHQAAFDHCYCNHQPLECTDGTTAKMCNTLPIDDRVTFERSDGEMAPLLDGVAQCIGASTCGFSTENCGFESWYVRCGNRFVSSQGDVYTTESEAVVACNVETGLGSCRRAIEDCATLTNCRNSDACWNDTLDRCESSPRCSSHDLTKCLSDAACRWEGK